MDQLQHLSNEIATFVEERKWEPFHQPKDLALSIVVECGELLELFQWRSGTEIEQLLHSHQYLENVSDEVADVFIYLVALANRLGIDLAETALNILHKNADKYPVETYRGTAHRNQERYQR